MLAANNVIELFAASNHVRNGHCDEGPELIAELLPTSVLLRGDEIYSDTMTELRRALLNTGPLAVGTTSQLTSSDASNAIELLAEMLPVDANIRPFSQTAQILVVSPADIPFLLPKTEPIWVVHRDDATGKAVARALVGGTEFSQHSVAILVIPNGLTLAGEAT